MTKFEILPDGDLKITITEDGKQELQGLKERHGENDEAILLDLIEDNLCNGYHLVDPKAIGALTSSLIISDTIIEAETIEFELDNAKIWWFPDYMVASYIDGIGEGIIFTKAQ